MCFAVVTKRREAAVKARVLRTEPMTSSAKQLELWTNVSSEPREERSLNIHHTITTMPTGEMIEKTGSYKSILESGRHNGALQMWKVSATRFSSFSKAQHYPNSSSESLSLGSRWDALFVSWSANSFWWEGSNLGMQEVQPKRPPWYQKNFVLLTFWSCQLSHSLYPSSFHTYSTKPNTAHTNFSQSTLSFTCRPVDIKQNFALVHTFSCSYLHNIIPFLKDVGCGFRRSYAVEASYF